MTVDTLPLPTYGDATVVVPAPDSGPGNWSGAASAVLVDGTFWLTYRVRRPLTEGRGVAVVVARSDDGVRFEPVTEVARETFGCESFERPVLVPVPGLRLAALPLLRDVRLQALVGRLAHRTHGRGAAGRPPAGGAARRRAGRGQGPGHPAPDPPRRGVGDVAVLPPAHRARPRGPDDHPPAHLARRPRVDRPRRGARRPPRPVGRTRRPGGHRPDRGPADRALRRPRGRRVQLARDHRRRPLGRHPPGRRPTTRRSRRRTPTARSATPPRSRSPTAGPASTSRPPAPTAPTTW